VKSFEMGLVGAHSYTNFSIRARESSRCNFTYRVFVRDCRRIEIEFFLLWLLLSTAN